MRVLPQCSPPPSGAEIASTDLGTPGQAGAQSLGVFDALRTQDDVRPQDDVSREAPFPEQHGVSVFALSTLKPSATLHSK